MFFPWTYDINYLCNDDIKALSSSTTEPSMLDIREAKPYSAANANTTNDNNNARSCVFDKAIFDFKKKIFELVTELFDEYVKIVDPETDDDAAKYG